MHNDHDLGVSSPGSLHTNGTEEISDGATAHLIDGQHRGFRLHDMSSAASKSSVHQLTVSPLGRPAKKRKIHAFDAFAVGLAFFCAVLGVMAVANNKFSWHLGVANYQLIVIGFLLSIMNLCLGIVAPVLFLLLEAKFGPSVVQNYDAILRNKPLASGLNILWRVVLGIMVALPLALSIAYKTFTGGESALKVIDSDYISEASFYGMFPPPGVKSIGASIGLSIFFNATLPFLVASSQASNGSEPHPPTYPHPYGFNILSLSNESTAILDLPQPEYVSAVQDLLDLGDSWTITAPVAATVATLNRSMIEDPSEYNSTFTAACEAGQVDNNWALYVTDMYIYWSLILLEKIGISDQSVQYIGLAPGTQTPCSNLSTYTQLYNVNRQQCQGTWSVTRGGIQLAEGSCNGTILPIEKQGMIVNQELIGGFYVPSLIEVLSMFSGGGTRGNQSAWFGPSMATSVAAMCWSRITGLDSPAQYNFDGFNLSTGQVNGTGYPWMFYPVTNQTVLYTRPTLRKTGLLYFIITLQPLLVAIVLVLIVSYHSTPLDRGFGLVSILSGVDRQSLDSLAGATLSGQLTKQVKLDIFPLQDGTDGKIEYRIATSSGAPVHRGKLVQDLVYY